MLSNNNAKVNQCLVMSFLAHVYCLQYADHTDRATSPIGVKGRRKEKKKRKEKKEAVPGAAAAYGRQLKIVLKISTSGFFLHTQKRGRYFDYFEEFCQ